jgi:hypothetical protein
MGDSLGCRLLLKPARLEDSGPRTAPARPSPLCQSGDRSPGLFGSGLIECGQNVGRGPEDLTRGREGFQNAGSRPQRKAEFAGLFCLVRHCMRQRAGHSMHGRWRFRALQLHARSEGVIGSSSGVGFKENDGKSRGCRFPARKHVVASPGGRLFTRPLKTAETVRGSSSVRCC